MLRVNNLSFRYSEKDDYLWKPLNFDAGEGQIIFLKGKNGSGKTTLLHILCGIIPQAITGDMRGEVFYKEKPLSKIPLKVLAPHINLLFQEPDKQIFMPLVEEEIAFGLENLCIPGQEIERRLTNILKQFDIEHLRQRSTVNLSYGQKKLVVLAGILVMSPQIILIDEFTSSMEEKIIKRFLFYVTELKKEGKLIVLSDHHPFLEESADLIINLDGMNTRITSCGRKT